MNALAPSKQQRLYLFVILFCGTILRLVRLGSQSFSYDEVYSTCLSDKSLDVVATRFSQTPALYHILLHFWLNLGRSDAMVRLLSALFGVVTLWVIYLLGKKFFDSQCGLISALLLAISPFHIWYSQDARMYGLFILLCTASVLLYFQFLQQKRGWLCFWWAVLTSLAICTIYYAMFILVFQVIFFMLFWPKYRSCRKSFFIALGGMALVAMPILLVFVLRGRFSELLVEGAGANPLQIFSIPYTCFFSRI